MNSRIDSTVVEFKKNAQTGDSDPPDGRNVPVFYTQLIKRNVLRAAATYVVGAWVVAQVADVLCDGFVAPEWVMRTILIALALGLPIVILISWYFDFSVSLKWETDTAPIGAITRAKGRRIDFAIISVLTLIVSVLLVWRPEEVSEANIVCLPGQEYSQSIAPGKPHERNATPN